MTQPDVASKRQVSESALLFLHAQIIDYNLYGNGAKFYDAPPSSISSSSAKDANNDDGDINMKEKDEATLSAGLQQPAKRRRIEAMGQDIGRRLAERHAHYRDRMEQDLEKVKFICKDFWESTFRKQIDVLRTNHRGLYVLTDNNFQWLSSISPPKPPNDDLLPEQLQTESVTELSAEDFVVMPCGIICGALTRLGLRCRVTADLYPLEEAGYRVSFNVQLIQ